MFPAFCSPHTLLLLFFPGCEIKPGWLDISHKIKSHCNLVLHGDLLFMCEHITYLPIKMLSVTNAFRPPLQLGVGWGQRQAWPLLSEGLLPETSSQSGKEVKELMEDWTRRFWLGKYSYFYMPWGFLDVVEKQSYILFFKVFPLSE